MSSGDTGEVGTMYLFFFLTEVFCAEEAVVDTLTEKSSKKKDSKKQSLDNNKH